MANTEAQKRAQAKYDKANTYMLSVKLNRETDKDILDRLQKESNMAGYIKELIRRDMVQG